MTKKKNQPSTTGAAAVQQLCAAVAEAMLDKKAQNVASLDLTSIDGAIASCFVLCNADSTTQVEAIADNVEEQVRKTLGEKPIRREGFENAIWIILDYVDVMVHIFQTEARNFYRLEQLWADAGQQHYSDERQPAEDEAASVKAPAKRKTAAVKAAAASPKSKPKSKTSAGKAATAKTTVAKKAGAAKKAAGAAVAKAAPKKAAAAKKRATTAESKKS
jgi:ribosome-associated protein